MKSNIHFLGISMIFHNSPPFLRCSCCKWWLLCWQWRQQGTTSASRGGIHPWSNHWHVCGTLQGCRIPTCWGGSRVRIYSRSPQTWFYCTPMPLLHLNCTLLRTQCWCGNHEVPSSLKVPESQCFDACTGNANQICGEQWRINVYPVDTGELV